MTVPDTCRRAGPGGCSPGTSIRCPSPKASSHSSANTFLPCPPQLRCPPSPGVRDPQAHLCWVCEGVKHTVPSPVAEMMGVQPGRAWGLWGSGEGKPIYFHGVRDREWKIWKTLWRVPFALGLES